MKIGIIVAMSKELAMILPLLSDATVETRGAVTLHRGRIGGNDIAVMQCGIGKVNAAIGAVSLIDAFSPDLVINTGVAAGAGDDIRVMDIVVADSLAHHDFWCIGEEWGHVPRLSPVFSRPRCRLLRKKAERRRVSSPPESCS